eukprot:6213584-Pleurochrysis_carterae.AAC.2
MCALCLHAGLSCGTSTAATRLMRVTPLPPSRTPTMLQRVGAASSVGGHRMAVLRVRLAAVIAPSPLTTTTTTTATTATTAMTATVKAATMALAAPTVATQTTSCQANRQPSKTNESVAASLRTAASRRTAASLSEVRCAREEGARRRASSSSRRARSSCASV